MKALLVFAIFTLTLLPMAAPAAAPRDTMPDTWAAVDALGRPLPDEKTCPAPRPGKFVGIFYFVWIEARPGQAVRDLTQLVAANPDHPAYGPPSSFHWWGKPRLGYYSSNDPYVIRKHAQMLADAGVDVIIIDVTNALTYDSTVMVLCQTYQQIRAEGGKTPRIAFILHSKYEQTAQHLYDNFYAKNLYPELWFRWEGKPLMLAPAAGLSAQVREFFTLRESWAWSNPKSWFADGHDKWPWLDNHPQKPGWHDRPDKPEQITVCVAQHPLSNYGRSYHAGKQPPPGQTRTAEGLCFDEQWQRALQVDPAFVFVTGWNEWIAQRFVRGKSGPGAMIGKPIGPGDTFFVDTFSQEFSRDIEPMDAGHGDNYYYQFVANIRRFKGVRPPPRPSSAKRIPIGAGFDSWRDVSPEYLDDIADTAHRHHPGYGGASPLINDTGRNDFDTMKVARDDQNLYFYVRTREPITPPQGQDWMLLLINTHAKAKPAWNGYDILINRARPTDRTCTVERNADGQWNWTAAGTAAWEMKANELHLAVPRKLLGIDGHVDIEFKWADHVGGNPNIADFMDQGDVAPNGRFGYRYRE